MRHKPSKPNTMTKTKISNLALLEISLSIAEIDNSTNIALIAKRMMEAISKKEISSKKLEVLLIALKDKCSKYGHNLN